MGGVGGQPVYGLQQQPGAFPMQPGMYPVQQQPQLQMGPYQMAHPQGMMQQQQQYNPQQQQQVWQPPPAEVAANQEPVAPQEMGGQAVKPYPGEQPGLAHS